MRASLPLLVGVVPFGLVAGVAAVDAGLSPAAAFGMSVVVFAGASQLAVIELLRSDTPLVVVVLTGVVVNLRMLMYSASIAPYFQRYRTRWKALLAYFLTDQAYAVAIARYTRDDDTDGGTDSGDGHADVEADADGEHEQLAANGAGEPSADVGDLGRSQNREPAEREPRRDWYYLGVAATIWAVWVVATAVGVGVGRGLPDEWGLGFAVPLVFLALLVPRLEDGATTAAGVAAGAVALGGSSLPYELGLPVAAVVGVATGLVVEEVRDP
jgi:predicted branched-subunit amino acid permease